MKRVLIVFIFVLMHLFSGNAQVFVGGGLRLSIGDGKNSWGSTENSGYSFGFSISPQVGYYLNEDWAIGVNCYLANDWSNGNRNDPDDPTYDRNYKSFSNSWGFNFFGRHKLLGLGIENLSLLVEGTIGIQCSNNKYTENGATKNTPGSTVYGINARPALSYKISDKIDVLAYCNFLSMGYNYQTQKNSETNYKFKSHNFNLGFNSFSDMSIGFIYKF